MQRKKPAWYKVTIDHGPGHQSRTIRYVYSTPGRIQLEVEDMNLEYPIMTARKVSKLPPKEKEWMIASQKSKIASAKSMLKLLARV